MYIMMSIITVKWLMKEGIYIDLNIIVSLMVKKANSLKISFKFEKNNEGVSEVKMMDSNKPAKKEKKIKKKKDKVPKLNKQPKNVANSQLLEQITQNLKKDLKI